ncbi:uncharacterized protein LOC120333169 isoform X1 [Styela clava]
MFDNATASRENLSVWCIVVPFCDTRNCNISQHDAPTSCDKCYPVTIALLFIVLLFLSVFIVLGNIGIILVIMRNKIFHNPFHMFKCSLAVADLLVGILVLPGALVEIPIVLLTPYDHNKTNYDGDTETIYTWNGKTVHPDSVCARIHREGLTTYGMLLSIVGVLSIMASILSLVLLSVDRFLAVLCPIKYNQGRAIGNKMAGVLIMLVWVACITLSVILPIAMGDEYFSFVLTSTMVFTMGVKDSDVVFFYTIFSIGLPYITLLGLNLGTGALLFKKWAKIKKRTNNVPKTSPTRQTSQAIRRRNEVKATVTLLVMVLVFTMSTVPSLIVLMVFNDQNAKGTYEEGNYTEGIIYVFLVLLLVSNSAWNFIIYSWRNENFRKALKKMFATTIGKKRKFSWEKFKSMITRGDSDRKRRRKMIAKRSKSGEERKMNITTVNGKAQTQKDPKTGMPITFIPTTNHQQVWRGDNNDVINTTGKRQDKNSQLSLNIYSPIERYNSLTRSISASSNTNGFTRCTASTVVSPEMSPAIMEEDDSIVFFSAIDDSVDNSNSTETDKNMTSQMESSELENIHEFETDAQEDCTEETPKVAKTEETSENQAEKETEEC